MSQLLSKTLIPHGKSFLRRFNDPVIPASFVCFSRRFSSKPQLIEIDLDSSSSSSASSKAEAEAAILKKLNEFVRRIIVQNSTPDWLPFAPGSSFWVPPHKNTAEKIANLVNKVRNPMTEEESLSISSPFGWPCSSFFIPSDGSESSSTQEVEEVSMELNIPGNEILEVKLAHFPDPIYSFKPGDDEE